MSIDFSLDRPAADARIVVAMSGGVDSSVVAARAAKTGAEVIGVTLQLYDHGEAVKRSGSCCAGQDIYDARMVADRLGIAHYVLDYESRSTSCAFPSATCRRARCESWPTRQGLPSPPSPTARTSVSCPTAIMRRW